ncbi:Uncharacterised protein [Citrobacter koseri]|uniref:Uncharacterized protein n=1 Tax=Citrobacter koseri TaxID=545 RepID=A0A2X2WNK6_CITKO|nr:Uncharacterised protein [Citrobacter koseri]
MATHVFADMMHHLYQAFDLFEKGDKRACCAQEWQLFVPSIFFWQNS